MKPEKVLERVHEFITGDEDARVCKDIDEQACHHQPRNFVAWLVANVLQKIADELTSARLVFPWLLGALGAPAAFVGFVVPIREAGVLMPQLFVAAWIRRQPLRKPAWLVGAGLSVLTLAGLALTVDIARGVSAGWLVLGMLTLFSLARGICSVAAKDVVGKTIAKTRRGVLMGYAAAVSGYATLALGLSLQTWGGDLRDIAVFEAFLWSAAALWLLAMLSFAAIVESPGATSGGGNAIKSALQSLVLLKTDRIFRQFVIGRSLLLSVALAPPFYVVLAQQSGQGIGGLGILVIASGLAGSLSSPFWGRFSDRSSRDVMAVSALVAGLLGILVLLLSVVGATWVSNYWVTAVLFFLVAVCHGGARLGRKVYLVDMADSDNRSAYVAVSNTVIGVAMLGAGGIGVLADFLSPAAVIGLLGLISCLSALYCRKLVDVSG